MHRRGNDGSWDRKKKKCRLSNVDAREKHRWSSPSGDPDVACLLLDTSNVRNKLVESSVVVDGLGEHLRESEDRLCSSNEVEDDLSRLQSKGKGSKNNVSYVSHSEREREGWEKKEEERTDSGPSIRAPLKSRSRESTDEGSWKEDQNDSIKLASFGRSRGHEGRRRTVLEPEVRDALDRGEKSPETARAAFSASRTLIWEIENAKSRVRGSVR